MTVGEMIKELSKYSDDTEVFYDGGEWQDNWYPVYKLKYNDVNKLNIPKGILLE